MKRRRGLSVVREGGFMLGFVFKFVLFKVRERSFNGVVLRV